VYQSTLSLRVIKKQKYHGGEDGVEGLEGGLRDVDERRVSPHPRFLPDRSTRTFSAAIEKEAFSRV